MDRSHRARDYLIVGFLLTPTLYRLFVASICLNMDHCERTSQMCEGLLDKQFFSFRLFYRFSCATIHLHLTRLQIIEAFAFWIEMGVVTGGCVYLLQYLYTRKYSGPSFSSVPPANSKAAFMQPPPPGPPPHGPARSHVSMQQSYAICHPSTQATLHVSKRYSIQPSSNPSLRLASVTKSRFLYAPDQHRSAAIPLASEPMQNQGLFERVDGQDD